MATYLAYIVGNVEVLIPDMSTMQAADAETLLAANEYTDTKAVSTLQQAQVLADAAAAKAIQDILPPLVPPVPPPIGYGAWEWYDAGKNTYHIIRDQNYIDVSVSNGFIQAKAYTNDKAAEVNTAANNYTDTVALQVTINCNTYTDEQIAANIHTILDKVAELRDYIDNHKWTVADITDFAITIDNILINYATKTYVQEEIAKIPGGVPITLTGFVQGIQDSTGNVNTTIGAAQLKDIPAGGDVDLGGNSIINCRQPQDERDVVNLEYLWLLINDRI